MNKDRVELCCHTKMSKLQGIDSIKEYIEEAIKRGYKSIAITDTNSTQAYFEAEEYIKQYNTTNDFKIIYGIELNFKENKNSNETYTIYIYVKEQKGLKNLYELVSDSYKNIVKDKPLIYKKELDKYRDGLLYAAIGKESEAYQNIESLDISNIFDYYDFIGIEPNNSDKNINKKISDICTKTKKLLIGTSECNFINKDDYKCNEILNFYKKSNNIEEGNNKYFQNTDELIKCFNYIENAEEIVVANPQKIADEIENIELIPKKAHYPIIKNSKKILREDCYNKVYALYGKNLSKVVKERLELELNSITNNNFETIYLISSELVKYSNELGYKVGSRGSVGNSFVAYLLGITNINPIDYNLPFEIFAGKDYDKEPDIDLNFSGKIHTKIFDYLQKKYGKDKIIWGGTVGSLADKIISNCYKEYISTFEIENGTDKDEIIKKLIGVKRCTGEHPGGIFIVPDDMDITDLCPIEIGEKGHIKTHNDYHSIWNSGLYKFDILTHDDPTMIYELEKETNINSNNIDLEDKETLKLFLHANDKSYEISTDGIPEFGTSFVKKMIDIVKPRKFNDLVCISALSHGTNTWTYNASSLIKKDGKKVDEVISNRADMYNYLIANGIDKNITCDIVKFVRMGKASKGRTLWQHTNDRYKENNDKWTEYKKVMQKQNIPDWYINSAEKISYMFPKSHAIEYSTNAFKIAWYKVHYPEAFYKVYFKIKSDLKVKEYYCKRQIRTELKRLYDEKETHENNKEFDYDCNNDDKIRDLELVLEMYNRGILKEKKEINDDYNLINSRAIGDYCRSIQHRFNTEELAVLVFRNCKMSIDEKIEKYNDLIKNYPDMEVIERINCKHYDSVKTMIKKEIQRLNILYRKLLQKNDNSIYTWTEYNKSTLKTEHNRDLERTFKTYKEAIKDVQNHIQEYDDTISFRITKKYFDKRKGDIFADYNVENRKSKLINLMESNDNFLDIDQIFLNIPTPFKKGDILVSNNPEIGTWGDRNEIFVLEYLCTWRDNLSRLLANGNYDSSDMIGYGYYFYDENSTDFIIDDKFNYDSFEYYDGELKGKNRILKDISNFMKGKIELELFVHAYDYFKSDFKNEFPDFYTDEGLKLAGFSDIDILQRNHENEKIYNMLNEKRDDYLKHRTCIYEKLEEKEILQIETDFNNKVFLLTKNGILYKTELYEHELLKISENIRKIHFLDGNHLYKISNENIILPIEDKNNFDNIDRYLNNNNCKYKKIETSKMHIVLLTQDGNVRAVCEGYPNLGIIPENFTNVNDITIVTNENGIDMPYIYKNNMFIELYIE